MLHRLLHIATHVNYARGIDLTLHSENSASMVLCDIAYKKSGIDVRKTEKGDFTDETLKRWKDVSKPLILVIDGAGVLHKKVKMHDTHENPAETAFPGSKPDDFYIQTMPASEHETWVSVIRRELVDDILNRLLQAGYPVKKVFLGPFPVVLSSSIFPTEEGYYTESGRHLTIRNNRIYEMKRIESMPESDTSFQHYALPRYALTAFSAALASFISLPGFKGIEALSVAESGKEFLFRTLLVRAGVILLLVFMLCSFGNLFLFSHFNKKYTALHTELAVHSTVLLQIDSLSDELNEKKDFIEKCGLSGRGRLSFFADRIASILPEQVTLTSIFVYPPEKLSDEKDIPIFQHTRIHIKGLCQQGLVFNTWVKQLKLFEWVNNLSIINYNQPTDGPAEFDLSLTIKL